METLNNLPFELPNLQDLQRDHWYDFDKSYVKYLYDNRSSLGEIHGFNPKSYWLALKPAYEANGQRFFYREGIIAISGRLKWNKGWESAPRDEVWLI